MVRCPHIPLTIVPGVPVDPVQAKVLRDNWPEVKRRLIVTSDQNGCVFPDDNLRIMLADMDGKRYKLDSHGRLVVRDSGDGDHLIPNWQLALAAPKEGWGFALASYDGEIDRNGMLKALLIDSINDAVKCGLRVCGIANNDAILIVAYQLCLNRHLTILQRILSLAWRRETGDGVETKVVMIDRPELLAPSENSEGKLTFAGTLRSVINEVSLSNGCLCPVSRPETIDNSTTHSIL